MCDFRFTSIVFVCTNRNQIYSEVELTYDRFSRLSVWRWGDLKEMYGYDRAGRLAEIRYADGKSTLYVFKDMFSSLVSFRIYRLNPILFSVERQSYLGRR